MVGATERGGPNAWNRAGEGWCCVDVVLGVADGFGEIHSCPGVDTVAECPGIDVVSPWRRFAFLFRSSTVGLCRRA